ncbi:MAG: molybdopterin converting factor subunit 1 [Paraglaciecola sp.]|jgi:molybdopterin converting factor subunit 1
MNINILAFGIAKDIIQTQKLPFEVEKGATVGLLKEQLCIQFPEFQRLKSLAIAVNEEYQEDDFELKERDEIVIIPPVSGG